MVEVPRPVWSKTRVVVGLYVSALLMQGHLYSHRTVDAHLLKLVNMHLVIDNAS